MNTDERIAVALERIAAAVEKIAARDDAPVSVSVELNEDALIEAMAAARRRGPFAL